MARASPHSRSGSPRNIQEELDLAPRFRNLEVIGGFELPFVSHTHRDGRSQSRWQDSMAIRFPGRCIEEELQLSTSKNRAAGRMSTEMGDICAICDRASISEKR